MMENWKRLHPKKKLRVYSITFVVVSAMVFVMVFSSIAVTASNLMITNQLATESQLYGLQNGFSLYLTSQNCMVAFDVLLLFCLPLLVFSVFTFYTKGNFIIIIFLSLFNLIRLAFGMTFIFASSPQKEVWETLWTTTNHATAKECSNQTCGDNIVNYVLCGKLTLWDQLNSFEVVFCVGWSLLSIFQVFLALQTNKLDTQLAQLEESSRK